MNIEIRVPDIGDFAAVEIVEIMIAVGQQISAEQSVILLESDKAAMEIPAAAAGTVTQIAVTVGDKVKQGDLIAILEGQASAAKADDVTAASAAKTDDVTAASAAKTDDVTVTKTDDVTAASAAKINDVTAASAAKINDVTDVTAAKTTKIPHASPAVRRFARELGIDLHDVTGSARRGRILQEDVKNFVKNNRGNLQNNTGKTPDFAQFGAIHELKLSRINMLTAAAMSRNWREIPHVTQQQWADITALEEFRQSLRQEAQQRQLRVTLLAFLIKALYVALKELPRFNSSLAADGNSLIMKDYYNIGIAVDTPAGLVVPVIRNVDSKGIYDLCRELEELSQRARSGKLTPHDISGGCITISSLGGIGGGFFTPIVNAPEVAILGVSRAVTTAVWDGKQFLPRLMLPLSLSYDHRVIDGALGARMSGFLATLLADINRIML